MGTASNKVLNRLVGNVFARQVLQTGRELNATQKRVMVRLQNAVAIEEACEALRINEGSK